MTAESAAYQVSGLRFSYPGSNWALKDLSFSVQQNEILGIIGPNGSGKTSLLKLLAHLVRPLSGEIRLFGHTIGNLPQDEIARSVALVPQDSPQLFPFTLAQMILMGRFPHHVVKGGLWLGTFGWESYEDRRLATLAMQETDVTHLAARRIQEVSGGERQRAMIARALAQEPRVLLLDEPTAFLDLSHQVEICRLLRRLNEERGLTVVMVSHDLNLAGQYCDRLMLLDEGEIIRLGTPDEVIRPDVLEEVYCCKVLVDRHPQSGLPRVTLPGRTKSMTREQ